MLFREIFGVGEWREVPLFLKEIQLHNSPDDVLVLSFQKKNLHHQGIWCLPMKCDCILT